MARSGKTGTLSLECAPAAANVRAVKRWKIQQHPSSTRAYGEAGLYTCHNCGHMMSDMCGRSTKQCRRNLRKTDRIAQSCLPKASGNGALEGTQLWPIVMLCLALLTGRFHSMGGGREGAARGAYGKFTEELFVLNLLLGGPVCALQGKGWHTTSASLSCTPYPHVRAGGHPSVGGGLGTVCPASGSRALVGAVSGGFGKGGWTRFCGQEWNVCPTTHGCCLRCVRSPVGADTRHIRSRGWSLRSPYAQTRPFGLVCTRPQPRLQPPSVCLSLGPLSRRYCDAERHRAVPGSHFCAAQRQQPAHFEHETVQHAQTHKTRAAASGPAAQHRQHLLLHLPQPPPQRGHGARFTGAQDQR